MTPDDRQKLREAAVVAVSATPPRTSVERVLGRWSLQTSNSFRRIGCHGDGDVLCGTKHPHDGHPDLLARPGVLDYIVAAQPRVVLELLDAAEATADKLQRTRTFAEKLLTTTKRFAVELAALNENAAAEEMCAVVAQLEASLVEMSR
ncbi:MAG: hypothetical protein MUO41_02755 [Methyloceanibacter sp.]|nr:hypothetical protein [Methyloceanibacter sp.]